MSSVYVSTMCCRVWVRFETCAGSAQARGAGNVNDVGMQVNVPGFALIEDLELKIGFFDGLTDADNSARGRASTNR